MVTTELRAALEVQRDLITSDSGNKNPAVAGGPRTDNESQSEEQKHSSRREKHTPDHACSLRSREAVDPEARDVDPAHEARVVACEHILDKALQRVRPVRLTGPARVDADCHQPRAVSLPSLADEKVEAEPEVLEEVARRAVRGGNEVPVVVEHLRVGDDQERRPFHVCEVGQLVVAGVRVVQEAALFDEQLARIHARKRADVPTADPLARRTLDRLDRELHPGPLFLPVELPVVGPAMAVAKDLVLPRTQPLAQLRIAFQRDGARADADENGVLIEQAREPPHPDPAAELEVRLGAEVP